jgi:hypothetical protein
MGITNNMQCDRQHHQGMKSPSVVGLCSCISDTKPAFLQTCALVAYFPPGQCNDTTKATELVCMKSKGKMSSAVDLAVWPLEKAVQDAFPSEGPEQKDAPVWLKQRLPSRPMPLQPDRSHLTPWKGVSFHRSKQPTVLYQFPCDIGASSPSLEFMVIKGPYQELMVKQKGGVHPNMEAAGPGFWMTHCLETDHNHTYHDASHF